MNKIKGQLVILVSGIVVGFMISFFVILPFFLDRLEIENRELRILNGELRDGIVNISKKCK